MNQTMGTLAWEFSDPISNWLRAIFLKPSNSELGTDTWGTDNLFLLVTWINIIFFLVVVIPMLYWVMKYRRRPGVPAQRTPNHNTALEVTWVVVPLLILVVVFFWGFQGYMKSQVAKANAETINVVGRKWNWEIRYANGAIPPHQLYQDDKRNAVEGGVFTGARGNVGMPMFIVREGVPLKFLLRSEDVMHSFYIPDMRLKMDLFPNRYTSLAFIPQTSKQTPEQRMVSVGPLTSDSMAGINPPIPGSDHHVFCAEYCGINHSEMAAVLRVVTQETYDKVMADWADIYKGQPLVEVGKMVHTRVCSSCHSVNGDKNTGPTWKDAYGTQVPLKGGGSVPMDENYIRESIDYPAAKIHEGFENKMTPFKGQLSDLEYQGIMAYFRSLAGKATDADKAAPAATPAGAAPAPESK
ncbi:MAG TPA: cytochrome c oxidase subunit II transmembrane domain-containing protein [Phycisphaerales bacterium]|nr:cytochrome c oxidase subunit II transmembrane domain-containing protein [Phycisphaerales bacterium]